MLFNEFTDSKPDEGRSVICKSVHGIFYAARYFEHEGFLPYAHTMSDAPIGEVTKWVYQDKLE